MDGDMQTADQQLARIEGQIRGIRKMLDTERDCQEVVQQLIAVRNSLSSVGNLIIQDRLKLCTKTQDFETVSQTIAQAFKII